MKSFQRTITIVHLIIGIIIVFFVGLCLMALVGITRIPWLIRRWRMGRKSQQSSPLTRRPTVPEWLEDGEVARVQLPRGHCEVYTRSFRVEYDVNRRRELAKEAVEWARSLVGRYEGAALRIPDDCCVVSVPMRNFKCGSHPCEFLPGNIGNGADGAPEDVPKDAEFLYQMHGDQRIQVVTYIEDGTAYCAGYCIYIRRPYEASINYPNNIVEQCYLSPKYKPTGKKNTIPPAVQNASLKTENLKTSFCKRLKKPVMIGEEDGKVRHFEWSDDVRAFKTTECSECKMDDDLPSYEEIERNW